jgi:membrane associated rhomboid family serine protease
MDYQGQVGPILGPRVISLGLGWLIVNLVMAVTGSLLTMGTGAVAWEAHLIGFVVGVLLVGPFARWAGVRPETPETD